MPLVDQTYVDGAAREAIKHLKKNPANQKTLNHCLQFFIDCQAALVSAGAKPIYSDAKTNCIVDTSNCYQQYLAKPSIQAYIKCVEMQ